MDQVSAPYRRHFIMFIICQPYSYTIRSGGNGKDALHVSDCPRIMFRKLIGFRVFQRGHMFRQTADCPATPGIRRINGLPQKIEKTFDIRI